MTEGGGKVSVTGLQEKSLGERGPLRKILKEEATRTGEHKPEAFTKLNRGQGKGEYRRVRKDR